MKRIALLVSVVFLFGVCTVPGAWAGTTGSRVSPATGRSTVISRGKGSMNQLMVNLDIDHAVPADVIRIFGEPEEYRWEGEVFAKNDLPRAYLMRYSDYFAIVISDEKVSEALFADAPLYVYEGQVTVGTTSNGVFAALGQPTKTVEGANASHVPGVFYKDVEGVTGSHYYAPLGHPLRLFFRDDRICSLYLTRSDNGDMSPPDTQNTQPGSMNAQAANLDIDHAGPADVIRVFGEPQRYAWDGETFEKDDLPAQYVMSYFDGFCVYVSHDQVMELRFSNTPLYVYGGKITIGSTSREVFAALGQPERTVEGVKSSYVPGVFYKDMEGVPGTHYYEPVGHPLRLFFRDDRICALYLTRSDFHGALHDDTPIMQPGSMNAQVAELDIDNAGPADVIRVFGEPEAYGWDDETFAKDDLPRTYLMRYSDYFSVVISHDTVIEMRFANAPVYTYGAITFGSTCDEVFAALGAPSEIVENEAPVSYTPGVFYQDVSEESGIHFYQPIGYPLRLCFRNDKVLALCLIRSEDVAR